MDQPEPEKTPGVRERFPAMYAGLREIAGRMMRDQKARSLAPTELVAEAFVKLTSEEDRRARDAVDASLRAELAAVKEAVRRVEGELASRSEERDALRDELRDLADERRADAAATERAAE